MLAPYRALFAVSGLPAVLGWALFGRLHVAVLGLGLTLLVVGWTDSYALAGAVVAALTIGQAVAGPLRGRSVDRGSPVRALLWCGLGYAAGLTVLALWPATWWPVAFGIAFLTGLALPPVSQIARATYPRLATGAAREAAYAVESTLQELLWMLGPALAAIAVATAGARQTVLLSAILAISGSVGFAVVLHRQFRPSDGPVQPVQPVADVSTAPDASGEPVPGKPAENASGASRSQRPLLAEPGLAAAMMVPLLLVAAFAVVDLVLIAWARDRGTPAIAGVLAVVWASGSAVGGLVMGGRAGRRRPRLGLRAAIVAAGLLPLVGILSPLFDNPSPLLVGAVLAVAGLAIAPTFAVATERISLLAPETRRAEAFGWMVTATTAGSAVGAPLAGWIVDRAGSAAGASAAVLLVVACAVFARWARRPSARPVGAPDSPAYAGR